MTEANKFLFLSTLSELKEKRTKLLDSDFWDRQDFQDIEYAILRINNELKLRSTWAE